MEMRCSPSYILKQPARIPNLACGLLASLVSILSSLITSRCCGVFYLGISFPHDFSLPVFGKMCEPSPPFIFNYHKLLGINIL